MRNTFTRYGTLTCDLGNDKILQDIARELKSFMLDIKELPEYGRVVFSMNENDKKTSLPEDAWEKMILNGVNYENK